MIITKSIICYTLLGMRAFVFIGLEIGGASVEVEMEAPIEA